MNRMHSEGAIAEYDLVRVRALDGMRVDGCGLGCRAPMIGDVGAVVSILSAEGVADALLVECVQADATTAWIASFPAGSLERMSSAKVAP